MVAPANTIRAGLRKQIRQRLRRLSTRSFGWRAADYVENVAQFKEALNLPQIVDILDTMDRAEGCRFFIKAAYQTFKSLCGQLRVMRDFYVRGGAALWYAPVDDFGKEFVKLKFTPLFDCIPEMKRILYADKAKRGAMNISMTGGASILMLSANTEMDRTGKTAEHIYRDETHRYGFKNGGKSYEGGWIEQTSNRRGASTESGRWTELDMSTGLTGQTEAADLWAVTDQRTWHCRCPKCRKLFIPDFTHRDEQTGEITGGIRYQKHYLPNGLPDSAAIAPTLYYECPRCHERLPDTQASRRAMSGTADRPIGIFVMMNASPAPNAIGWTCTAIAVRPWLAIVIRFEKAMLAWKRGDPEPLADWIREELGGIWNPAEHYKQQKTRPLGKVPYKMGEEWADEAKDEAGWPMRTAGVDVQQDHYVLSIRMWAKDSRSRLRWAEKITTSGRLLETLQKHKVYCRRVMLDTRYDGQVVRRLCQQNAWCSVLGEGDKDYIHKEIGDRRIYSEPRVIDAWQGTDKQGRGSVVEFNFSNRSALGRLFLLRTLETNDGDPHWTMAEDAPDWYNKEIDAYHRTTKNTDDGVEHGFAVHGPDHAADTEKINVVIASMLGLVGAESVESAAKS